MKWLAAALIAVMVVLHQDVWFWKDRTLVLGLVPIGLAYHVLFSCACACLMAFLVKTFWPKHLDEAEIESSSSDKGAS